MVSADRTGLQRVYYFRTALGVSASVAYFGVGAEEVVEGRLGDEGSLLHLFFDEVGYLQEGDFATREEIQLYDAMSTEGAD